MAFENTGHKHMSTRSSKTILCSFGWQGGRWQSWLEFCFLSAHCCLQFLEMQSSFSLFTWESLREQILQSEHHIGPFFCCAHNICLNTLTWSNQEAYFAALFLIHLLGLFLGLKNWAYFGCFSRFEIWKWTEKFTIGDTKGICRKRRPESHKHLTLVTCSLQRRLAKMAETLCFARKMRIGSLSWWCMLTCKPLCLQHWKTSWASQLFASLAELRGLIFFLMSLY